MMSTASNNNNNNSGTTSSGGAGGGGPTPLAETLQNLAIRHKNTVIYLVTKSTLSMFMVYLSVYVVLIFQ